ncbi:MAG TPA: hypothetical protein VF221_00140 [Chloroflexota bacterium]
MSTTTRRTLCSPDLVSSCRDVGLYLVRRNTGWYSSRSRKAFTAGDIALKFQATGIIIASRGGVAMEIRERIDRARESKRAQEAEASLGPVGNLFASPVVARVLVVFLQNPDAHLTLSQIKEWTGKRAKGTVQSSLQTLMASRLVRREGSGNRTVYHYAADRELGQRMFALIEASQREAAPGATSDISWLDGLMRTEPRASMLQPYGKRVEEIPSTEATERVLAAGEAVDGSERPRTRPGLRTRA